MIKGITEQENNIIKSILDEFPYEFYYYGSRVKGDHTKSSDLDILLMNNKKIPYSIIENIELKFNESKIPYVVNISQYANMDKHFYNLIKDSLIKVQ